MARKVITHRQNTLLLLMAALLCITFPAEAVQWQQLARTDRHDVALDVDSVRLNTFGRLTIWLRFIPRGEKQRRQAAAEFSRKDYRFHLEFYELDCGEGTAITGLIDVLGKGGQRLARLKGGGEPDVIIPGSVLDQASRQVCPDLQETPTDDEEAPGAVVEGRFPAAEKEIPDEARVQIAAARQVTEQNPDNAAGWVELGNAYYDADMPEPAIKAYDRALALSPNDSNVLNDQGAMYRQLGNFIQAVANFEKALVYNPNNLESLYNMGYIYGFDLNLPDRALEVWKRYLKLDSTSETARQVVSFIDRYKQPAQRSPNPAAVAPSEKPQLVP